MPKKQSKEIVKKTTKIPANIEMFENLEYTGFENVDNDSLSIPFLKIAQSTSPQVNEDDPGHIKGLKPGYFYNNISCRNLEKVVKVVALGYYRLFVEWAEGSNAPETTYTKFELEKAVNAGEVEKNGVFYKSSAGNPIKDTRYFFVSLPDFPEDGILLFPLASTSITHAKKWLTKASMLMMPNGKPYPLFAHIWEMSTALNENDFGKWYTLGTKKNTLISPVSMINQSQLEIIKQQLLVVKEYLKNVQMINYADVQEDSSESDVDYF